MAQAQANAWRDMLVRCGIRQQDVPAVNAAFGIGNQNQFQAFMGLLLRDLKSDIETILKNPANANLIPLVASKRVFAARVWGEFKKLRNEVPLPAGFDLQARDRFMEICAWLADADDSASNDKVDSIVPTDLAEWLKFKRQANAQLQVHLSAVLKHSIAYIIRDHQVPTQEMLNADYPSLDAELYMTAHLGGAQYNTDNARVFGLLELWLCHTDWWTFVVSKATKN
jgi:hypothetical protein